MLESYERQGLVAFRTPWRGLVDDFADHLAASADGDDLGGVLGEWLLERDEIDDVFADDQALEHAVIEQARRLATEASAPGAATHAPAANDDDEDDDLDDLDDLDDDFDLSHEGDDPEAEERERWIAAHARHPYAPKTRSGDGPVAASKFGGAALLHPGEAWPLCPSCARPMSLFVQLDLATLPAELPYPHREGMVQLFYCTNDDPLCEVDHEAWQPFGKSSLARWLSPSELERARQAASEAQDPTGDPTGEAAAVLEGWDRAPAELPGYEEDVPLPPESLDDLEDEAPTAQGATRPRPGDKLGGWPAWVQGPEYPTCPQCKTRMVYLLQLESNGLCRHQFGDLGAGHISQCRQHPEVVAFGWACH